MKSEAEVPEGAKTRTINGIYVPDGTSASVAFYNAGYYLNELEFFVGEDGTATIGMHLDQTIGSNDYVVVGEWKLWYMGDPDAGVTEQDVTSLIVNNDFDPARQEHFDHRRLDYHYAERLQGAHSFLQQEHLCPESVAVGSARGYLQADSSCLLPCW